MEVRIEVAKAVVAIARPTEEMIGEGIEVDANARRETETGAKKERFGEANRREQQAAPR
jgi:hypothetical protein